MKVIEFDLSYSNSDGFLKRTMTFMRFAVRSVGVALTTKADIVFATTTPLTVAIPGLAARWLRGKTFVFEVRDLWPELPKAMGVIRNPVVLGLMSALEFAAYRSADRLVGLSPGIREGIARLNVSPSRIAMVPNACDIELFQDPTVAPWRPDDIAQDDFLAVFTGTHGQANGLSAVLDAAAELKRRGVSGIKLLLVGDGKEKPQLVKRAMQEGLTDFVKFHNTVPKLKLVGLLKNADLGLQILADVPAFYYGTSPNKFFDYLAAGLPVLTNYPGWVADLVVESEAGLAVPPGDPAAFADALEKARDMAVRGILSREPALRLARSRFDRAKLAEEWADWVLGISVPAMVPERTIDMIDGGDRLRR